MDPRMLLSSMEGKTFLEHVQDYEEGMRFCRDFYKVIASPKFPRSIGEIV